MKKGITVILNGYKRPHALDRQIKATNSQTIKPFEIMLWYNANNEGVKQIQVDNNIKSAYCNFNFKYHGRFAFALLSQTEYIAIFDDDSIPEPKWFENCMNTFKTHEGILGSTGVILKTEAYKPFRKVGWNANKNIEVCEVDLVGHSWFFKRDWLKYMWMEYPISWENGEDIQFSYLCQKYGKIKTFVPPHHNNNIGWWGSNPQDGMKIGSDSVASFKTKNFINIRNNIVKECIKNGWVPLYKK